MRQLLDIKCVKNSCVIQDELSMIYVFHYESEILKITKGGVIIRLYIPSVTSSKMAKRVIEHFRGKTLTPKEWKKIKEDFRQ